MFRVNKEFVGEEQSLPMGIWFENYFAFSMPSPVIGCMKYLPPLLRHGSHLSPAGWLHCLVHWGKGQRR